MELGYSYIREYLTERFDISFASEDAGNAFALPAVFQEGGDVLPKRIYVGKPGMLQSLWEEDVLAICCLKDCENDLEEWRQNANVARRCVFIGLLDVDESLALSCLLDLFNREISWNNSLWHIGVSGEAGAVRSFLDASVELFDDVLLYYPVGEWRSVVYSAPRNKELSAIAGLVDQDGRYSQEVDYHALEDVFEAAAPIVSSMTDRFGKRIKVLAAQIRNNDGTYQGLLVSPIANEIHPQAQHWHMMQLRIALEACLNSAHSSRDGFSASPHSSLQILLSNKKRNIRGAKKQLQMFGFAIRSDYVCIVVDIAGQSEGPGISSYQHCSIIESMAEGCVAVERRGMLCVLFDKGQSEVTLVDFLRRMVDYFWIYSVQVGVSFPFADITQVRDYANQAEVALETGRDVQPSSPVHFFADVAVSYVLRRGASDLPTHLLCAPGVLKLQKMSDRGGVDFIGTLSVYVENLYNASQTAKALCIHRDTLQYRLERIADIAHLDLSDSNDRLYLEISLLLLGKAGCRPIENGLCDT